MTKLHNQQVKKQLFWTNGCYRAALLDYYGARLNKKEKRYNVTALKVLISDIWRETIDLEVHNLYIKRVLALDTKKLNMVVKAFQSGQQYRKQETIDAIMTELFERSANSETIDVHE